MANDQMPDELPTDQWLEELFASVDQPGDSPAPASVESAGSGEPAQPPVQSSGWEQDTFKDDEFRDTFGEGTDLEQIFGGSPDSQPKPEPKPEPPAPQEQEEKKEKAPVRKGRPKKKNGYGLFGIPHLLATFIWLAIIVVIGVSVGNMVWLCATDVLAFGRDPIVATVVVEEDDTMDDIAEKLKDAGLIRYTGLFKLYADLSNAEEEIRPGTYNFNSGTGDEELIVYDYMALVSYMSPSGGLTVVEDLRIPEGYTCAQIFKLLEENNVCSAKELEEYAANGELGDYWFLEGVTRGDKYCLEGYLFPNTYDFYENDEPERVLKKMLNAFDVNVNERMRDQLVALNDTLAAMMRKNGYNSSYIEDHKFTMREVVIVASMIEKESANTSESFTVASVIYNRLANAAKFPYLNIDATLVYALDGKSDLTEEDKKLDSPYNTYTSAGLTPGPISNPSQNSISAALDPEETAFYYYAFDPASGEHYFSKTYQEHLDFLSSLKGDA